MTRMTRDEAQDLIGRAAKIDNEEKETLTREEVIDAAREVGVSEVSVCIAESLAADEQFESQRRRERLQNKLRRIGNTLGMLAAILVACLVLGTSYIRSAQTEASNLLENVQEARANVHTALTRQGYVMAYWQNHRLLTCEQLTQTPNLPLSTSCAQETRNRNVEISGAENRVTVAVHRYDEAVSQYNTRVSGLPSRLFHGLPSHVPHSTEVSQW